MKFKHVWMLFALLAVTLLGVSRIQAQAAGEVAPAQHAVEANAAETHTDAPHGEAAGHEKKGLVDPEIGTLIFTILIFVALLVILRATAWNPILSGLKSREQAIREGLEAAAKARAEAEKTARELDAKISEVQRQAAQSLAQAKSDAVKVAEVIRKQAETDATALKNRTLQEIDAAKQQALAEINNHAAELGTSVARKILQREVKAEDQQRLVEQSLAELAASKN